MELISPTKDALSDHLLILSGTCRVLPPPTTVTAVESGLQGAFRAEFVVVGSGNCETSKGMFPDWLSAVAAQQDRGRRREAPERSVKVSVK